MPRGRSRRGHREIIGVTAPKQRDQWKEILLRKIVEDQGRETSLFVLFSLMPFSPPQQLFRAHHTPFQRSGLIGLSVRQKPKARRLAQAAIARSSSSSEIDF